jgi:hypothetical protein
LLGFDLGRVFLVEVAQWRRSRMPEQRVGVEIELGVQRDDVALAVAVQRVDLDQRGVGFHVATCRASGTRRLACASSLRHADASRDFLGLRGGEAGRGSTKTLMIFSVRGVSHFLDVHAALARGDEANFCVARSVLDRHVVFLLDVDAVLDVAGGGTFRPWGPVWWVLSCMPRISTGKALDVESIALGHLHAAALAAGQPAWIWALNDPDRARRAFGRRFHGVLHGEMP